MDALIKTINTYSGYDELWANGRLYIKYYGAAEQEVLFDGKHWQPAEAVSEAARLYLGSAAEFLDAADKCEQFKYPVGRIYEFLPDDRDRLLPAELFRLLMDDKGLGIDEAISVLVRTFGKALCGMAEIEPLQELQPRTAFLDKLLRDELKIRQLAFHDAYDGSFRSPLGAVEEGEPIVLSIASFGGVTDALLCVYGDDFSQELSMRRAGDMFTAQFIAPSPTALFYKFKLTASTFCAR